jgi:pimeloyl-ACP methyl ester carboxylesterase
MARRFVESLVSSLRCVIAIVALVIRPPFLQRLATRCRLVRYDSRGTGLSDQAVPGRSFATAQAALLTALDALLFDRFALTGIQIRTMMPLHTNISSGA